MKNSIQLSLLLIIILVSGCQPEENKSEQQEKPAMENSATIEKGKEDTRAKEGEKTLLIINYIKDESKTEYEQFMSDVFFDLIETSETPLMKNQYNQTRWLSPTRQNENGTWTYAFFMDPVVENGNYEFEPLFQEKYSKEESGRLIEQHNSYMASPPQFHSLIQTEH